MSDQDVFVPPLTAEERLMLHNLAAAVFGIPGDSESGLLVEMRELRRTLNRLYFAVLAAALSFAVGTGSIIFTLFAR